jgi:serine/threonine-protein kinase
VLLIAACFILGVGLTLFVAERLGAFAEPSSEIETYVQRARVALTARAFAAPPGENVRDITNAALHRWPGTPDVITVRKDAAREILTEARRSMDDDRPLAQRLTELALELDPSSVAARELHGNLAAPALRSATPAASSATIERKPAPVRAPRSKTPRPPPVRSAPEPTPPAPESPAIKEPARSPNPEGRWL